MVMASQRWTSSSNGGCSNSSSTNGEERSPNSSLDNSDDNSDDTKSEKFDDICRDFLRNVCKRGKRCKYRHPEPPEARELGKMAEFTFCHDFQNTGCRRAHCKFIHCSREEEEYYKQTGQLPVRLQQAAALGIGVIPNDTPLSKGEVPICKDYLKGECKRAGRCKYRHLSGTQYEYEVRTSEGATPALRPAGGPPTVAATPPAAPHNPQLPPPQQLPPPPPPNMANNRFDPTAAPPYSAEDAAYETAAYSNSAYDAVIPAKRKKLDFEADVTVAALNQISTFHLPATCVPPPPLRFCGTTDVRLLEEENIMLRRKVEELKKQVSDLAATNEVLLEQNARYRSGNRNNCSVVTTVPSLPIVTVNQMAMVTPTITTTVTPTLARPMMAVMPSGGLLNSLNSTLTSSLNPITTTSLASTLNPMSTTLNHLAPDHPASLSLSATLGAQLGSQLGTQLGTTLPQLTLNANSELVVSQPTLAPTALQPRHPGELAQGPPPPQQQQGPPPPGGLNAPPPPVSSIVPVSIQGMESALQPPPQQPPPPPQQHSAISSLAQSTLGPPHHSTVNMSSLGIASSAPLQMSMPSTPLISYPIMSHAQLPASTLNTLNSLQGPLNMTGRSAPSSINTSLG